MSKVCWIREAHRWVWQVPPAYGKTCPCFKLGADWFSCSHGRVIHSAELVEGLEGISRSQSMGYSSVAMKNARLRSFQPRAVSAITLFKLGTKFTSKLVVPGEGSSRPPAILPNTQIQRSTTLYEQLRGRGHKVGDETPLNTAILQQREADVRALALASSSAKKDIIVSLEVSPCVWDCTYLSIY